MFEVEARAAREGGGGEGRELVGDVAGDVDDGVFGAADVGRGRVGFLGVDVALAPAAGWGVGAEEDESDASGEDHGEWHQEGETPSLALGVSVGDKGIVHCGHDEVGQAAAGIAKTPGQGIRSAHDILVEEAGGPNLAGDEGASENADEETANVQARGVADEWCQAERDRAY